VYIFNISATMNLDKVKVTNLYYINWKKQ